MRRLRGTPRCALWRSFAYPPDRVNGCARIQEKIRRASVMKITPAVNATSTRKRACQHSARLQFLQRPIGEGERDVGASVMRSAVEYHAAYVGDVVAAQCSRLCRKFRRA